MLVNTMFVKWLQLSTLLSCCVFVREFNSSVVIKLFLLLGEPKIDFSARHVRTSRTVLRAHVRAKKQTALDITQPIGTECQMLSKTRHIVIRHTKFDVRTRNCT